MSREIRRVPMDFDWPLDTVWGGYITPKELHLPPCTACDYGGYDGPTGYTPEAYAIAQTFYPHMIAKDWTDQEMARAQKLAWIDKLGQAEVDNLVANQRCGVLVADDSERGSKWTYPPRTAAEINAENAPGHRGFGHDAINRWILVSFRCKVLGIVESCTVCEGHQNIGTQEQRDAYENWEWIQPPVGDGWQFWTTVTEGSPLSPVFATSEELVDWLVAHEGYSRPAAVKLCEVGHSVGSFIGTSEGIIDGVEALVGRKAKDEPVQGSS